MFALGATGGVGQMTVRKLATSGEVSDIVIAGRNPDGAQRVASELGAKATSLQVDAADEGRLASLAAGSDILLNAAGPDFRVALPAVRAAVKTGVHYCDVSADGPSTEKALALDAAAQAAGVTALLGIGTDPGVSNLMLMHAARQFDRVEELRSCWVLPLVSWGNPKEVLAGWRAAGHADASWQTMMRAVRRKVRVYRDGRLTEVDPIEDAVRITIPRGGRVTAQPLSGPLPITLPRTLPGVRSVSHLMSLLPPQLNEPYCDLGRRVAAGELDESAAACALYEMVVDDPDRWLADPEGHGSEFVVWAEATGTKQGQQVRYKCWPVGGWEGTATALATAALKILRGEVSRRGVLSPESCLEPMSFFREAAQHAPEKRPGGELLDESFEVLE